MIPTVVALLILSAICSGLNVALISLDLHELKRKAKLGNPYAKKVIPFRQKTHLTLAAILLTNVAAVSATSLVLESVLFGVLAGIITTLLIVTFGEILPQAYFSHNALKYMAKLRWVLYGMIFITYPFSKSLQILLDKLFKDKQSPLHSRRELGVIISEHIDHADSELDDDEVEIIRGALQLSEKRVNDILTPMEDVYWLTPDTKFTDKRVDEIKEIGRSRIPVFNRRQTRCHGVLLVKELVDVDFDEKDYRVDDFTLHPVHVVGSKTALDTLLRKFLSVNTQLIPVTRDDRIIGIVTIEDLIEEIVGQEIEDETDKRQLEAEGNA